MSERLQKIMASAGIGSRRHNEELIQAGRVRVNGNVARLGDSADPDKDEITLDGNPLTVQKSIYIMLNKPKGILSDSEDDPRRGRTTVRDLVDVPGHLYPIGRLDMESEGLILLSNDGDLAHRLTHPRYGHTKTYRVWVLGIPSADVLQQWRRGVTLEDGPTSPAEVDFVGREGPVSELRVVMREGRKRQIRRVAALLGHPVRRLQRVKIGNLHLYDVKPGEWRYLTPEEIRSLRQVLRDQKRGKPDRTRRPARPEEQPKSGPGARRPPGSADRPRHSSPRSTGPRRGGPRGGGSRR
jgi:pseudouridine synthase